MAPDIAILLLNWGVLGWGLKSSVDSKWNSGESKKNVRVTQNWMICFLMRFTMAEPVIIYAALFSVNDEELQWHSTKDLCHPEHWLPDEWKGKAFVTGVAQRQKYLVGKCLDRLRCVGSPWSAAWYPGILDILVFSSFSFHINSFIRQPSIAIIQPMSSLNSCSSPTQP